MSQKVVLVAGMVDVSVREATPAEAAAFAQDPTGERKAAREFVRYALSIGALTLYPDEGRKLKSGRLSPYFFNSGLFSTAVSIDRLAAAYVSVIEEHYDEDDLPAVVFGPAYKGIQIATMVAYQLSLGQYVYDPGIAFNRKETKDHGEGGVLVGSSLAGKRVLIVDDVITDGASKREAVELICAEGGTPIGCVIAFDRQERGIKEGDTCSAAQRFQGDFGLPVYAAATLDDLILLLEEDADFPGASEALPKILAYKDQYGV